MNIIDCISRNVFLKKLFPDGLVNDVLLGQINFDLKGRISLNIHTQQKPAEDVTKWGAWAKDYNVIVIELVGIGGKSVCIENWNNISFSKINITQEDGVFILTQSGNSWHIEIDFDVLIFQNCSTYIL